MSNQKLNLYLLFSSHLNLCYFFKTLISDIELHTHMRTHESIDLYLLYVTALVCSKFSSVVSTSIVVINKSKLLLSVLQVILYVYYRVITCCIL